MCVCVAALTFHVKCIVDPWSVFSSKRLVVRIRIPLEISICSVVFILSLQHSCSILASSGSCLVTVCLSSTRNVSCNLALVFALFVFIAGY